MSILTDIESFITGIGRDILAAVEALAHSIAQNGGAVLISAAASAVSAAETAGGAGEQKFAAAKSSVISVLEGQGLTVVTSAVNAAIEAAVAQMKANQVPAASVQAVS